MEYLARIKFRGFKSFKRAEATFSPGYVALAGPNGSGKSNVTDGIRFALGEMALKSLRAKKVPELINTGCKQAEVVLYFEGERKLEVRRAIRPDGKIAYQLNGKGTTRTGLLEALRLHRIEAGTHNIIAQGQVQQIIEMSSKEKREIIDSVAGISEYEAKKKEALGELEKVEGRIGEAKIVLAEREGFLVELEREKDSALAYKSAQESLRAARGTLVCRELEKLENEFESVHARMIEGKKLLESKQAQLSGVSGELSELEAKRSALFEKINQLSKKDSSMQAIATLKASIESAGTAIKEKLEAAQKLVSGMRGIDASIEEMQQEMGKIEEKAAGLKLEADRVQKEIDRFDSKSKEGRLGAQIENLKSEIGMMAAQIEQKKEEAVRLDAEISKIEELARFRSEEKQRLSVRGGSQEVDALKFTNELETLKKDIASLTAEIDKLFAKEKQTNKEVPEIEKELLLVREKVTVARVSAQASGTSPALVAVKEMRQSGAVRGIYGTVGELIKFEEEHATAIEAAANVRLNYIVVDSIEVAGKAIDYLKQRKAGRCTFIPLDKISPGGLEQANSMRKAEGVMGPLLDFVRFEAKYYGAMAYVFGDTVLVESFAAAKKIGPGKIRMVCTTGELFEKSGTVSGGFTRPVAFARSTLEKLEAQDAQLKGQREEKIGLLYSIRDEMAKKRKALAESQVAAKGLELELSALKTQGKAAQEMKSSIEAVIKQIENYETQVKEKRQQLERMEKEIDKATAEKEQLGAQLAGLEAKSKSDTSESDRAYAALISRKSELAATVKGELAQQQLYSKQLSALLSQKEGFEKEQKEHKAKSKALEAEIEKNKKELARHEQELAEFSKAAEKHYLLAKELEAKIVEIGKKKGKMEYEAQQLQKAQQELEVKKAGVEARLPELKADYENYKGMPLLEHPREQLLAMVKESEARMAGLGNVNLMAPQLYEEKKKDIEEVKGKLDRLADEKSAVFAMIEEIESKKHAIFMDTFRAVSDNFKKIFGYIFKGDGMLVLEKPSDPFNGGLSIKINEGGKERYIESMSGGEKALLAIIFIFAIQTHKPSAFYILDEADAALDKENSKKLAQLLRQMSATTQFIVVTHNDAVLSGADVVLGVSKTQDGSQMVGIELTGRKGILAQEGQTTRQMEAPVEPKGQRKITASATGAGKKDSVKKSDSEKEDNEDSLDFEEEKLSED